MTSLYRRATPSQQRVLRIIEGAVKNAADAHPETNISPQFRRSIAKRAAGTLTAQWPDVLAAKAPSDSPDGTAPIPLERRSADLSQAAGWGAPQVARRSPLRLFIKAVSSQIAPLRRSGQTQRADAFVDVLRMLHAINMPEALSPQCASAAASSKPITREAE